MVAGLYEVFDERRDLCDEDILRQLAMMIPLSRSMEEPVKALRSWALTRARPASGACPEPERRHKNSRNPRPDLDAVLLRPASRN